MPVFDRVRVDYVVQGGTRVWWELNRHFIDPGPYDFQLQVGHTGDQHADDWEDVGSSVTNTYMAVDPTKRLFGKTLDVHYRVVLTTPVSTYQSDPVPCDGLLSRKDWIDYKEIVRKEQLRHRVQTSVKGFLLKARRYGPPCPTCTDKFTDEITSAQCPTCFGTGFQFGYFTPIEATYADVSLEQTREHRDANKGMDKENKITARFVGNPQLYSYDVWVNGYSDQRYYIHTVVAKAQVRGVVAVYDAELRLAPFTDIIYTVPLSAEPSSMTPQMEVDVPLKEIQCKTPTLGYLESALNELKARRRRS